MPATVAPRSAARCAAMPAPQPASKSRVPGADARAGQHIIIARAELAFLHFGPIAGARTPKSAVHISGARGSILGDRLSFPSRSLRHWLDERITKPRKKQSRRVAHGGFGRVFGGETYFGMSPVMPSTKKPMPANSPSFATTPSASHAVPSCLFSGPVNG